MTIDEAIAHAREIAKEKRKEMQCKTCKLFARSDLHPLQGYCRKNEFRSIEIDSWSKVCSEYVPKEMCKCAEEHEQLAEWLEDYKRIKMLIPIEQALKAEYNKAIDDFIKAADKHCGYYAGECKNLTRDDLIGIANNMKLRSDG